jgi:hypothetical protein
MVANSAFCERIGLRNGVADRERQPVGRGVKREPHLMFGGEIVPPQ